MKTNYSELFKKYELAIATVRHDEWDSIHQLKNAIYQFTGFLEASVEFVEPSLC